ncbi:unannotated protein [freshwater metagenome]|uniref:Unannotated protein n=1 Tax=freshwater metagenome TaxID=449393 RepID=A0A6J6CI23_9ZZZZ
MLFPEPIVPKLKRKVAMVSHDHTGHRYLHWMRHWRWLVVLGGVAALCTAPVAWAMRPVPEIDVATADLVARVADSDVTPYEGIFESRGGLRLPDLGRLEDELAPFTQTSRVRVWYAAPDTWRSDELLIGAERSVYRQPGGLWLWDSGTRRVVFSPREGTEPLRIPRLMDLNPAELGRRLLAEAEGETVVRIADRWVAGQASVGLRILPRSETSTIEAAELWVDPDTGVVTAVEIETGGTAPAFETAFTSLRFRTPEFDVLAFDPEGSGEPVRSAVTVDPVESVSRTSFVPLPQELAGLPRRNDPQAGLATYGEGLTVVNMFVIPQGNLGRQINSLPRVERPWGGEALVIPTSLVNIQILTVDGFEVVLSGTVEIAELDRIAGELVAQGAVA